MAAEEDLGLQALEARLIELELRSEERRAEMQKIDEFVRAFENRIHRMEKQLDSLKKLLENPPEAMPAPSEDLPPHY